VADRENVRSYAVLDIDGVLADVRHRLHHLERSPKDWKSFFAAAPLDPVLDEGMRLAWRLATLYDIVYLTGRPERCRTATADWLLRNELPRGHQLLMRRDDDYRPGRITKTELLRGLAAVKPVHVLVDDDPTVVQAARQAGFDVIHAEWMGREPTLVEAQETDGRT
jgi:hypothetical protein